MRIAFIAVKGMPISGGIEKYTECLASHMASRGHDVTVYTTKNYGNVDGKYQNFYIKTIKAPKNVLEKIVLAYKAMKDQNKENFDIIHIHGLGPGPYPFLRIKKDRKIVIQYHGIEYQRAKWGKLGRFVLKYFEKHSFNNGDALTVVSKPLQRHFYETYKKNSIFIPTGVEMPGCTDSDGDCLSRFNITPDSYYLFIARLVEEKGCHYLIDAFKSTHSKRKLIIAGKIDDSNAYHKRLKDLAKDDSRITFVGEVIGREKEALFRNARSFVLPSEIEGMSIALLEAMSFKKCCIVSNIQENLDIAEGHAVVFNNKDELDLKNALIKVDNLGEKEISEIGNKAFEYVRLNHSFEIIADQMEDLYKTLLK